MRWGRSQTPACSMNAKARRASSESRDRAQPTPTARSSSRSGPRRLPGAAPEPGSDPDAAGSRPLSLSRAFSRSSDLMRALSLSICTLAPWPNSSAMVMKRQSRRMTTSEPISSMMPCVRRSTRKLPMMMAPSRQANQERKYLLAISALPFWLPCERCHSCNCVGTYRCPNAQMHSISSTMNKLAMDSAR